MTDRLPSEPAARFGARDWWKTRSLAGSLCPEDAGVHPAIPSHGVQSRDALLTTKMVSHGVDRSRVGLLATASARLRDLGAWLVIDDEPRPSPLAGDDLVRFLLRTAEEASGIPCSVSGLLYGLDPTPPPISLVLNDGLHQLSEMKSFFGLVTGSGKTAIVIDMLDGLTARLGSLGWNGRVPTATEIAHIADAAYALSALFLGLAQRLLNGYIKFFGHLVAVPPNECSPCGVLRLAAPRVPRAPGVSPVPGLTKFALAA